MTTAGVLIASGVAVAGCSVTSATKSSYEIGDSIRNLNVQDPAGKIEVMAGGDRVKVTETVRYSDGEPRTSHTTDGGTLRLTNGGCGGHVHVCAVDYRILVPAATSVNITNATGLVRLTNLSGDLNVSSHAGAIEGTGLSSAHATVRGNAGHISLRYAAAPSRVTATDDAGAIEVRVPKDGSYVVDTSTDAGHISISVPQDPTAARTISAHTHAGKITIGT
ncbi:DUF4097 family beta strand repeat-containing protein [Rugosimonospora africana]|uniref:DUF4097 family beta strand repeat-containing protein n=1 Tax=Rugosimonospora africana TaxID=556532 RepID=UPI001941C241|nr:DUF4097 family beta strand repeat-containing protein [Rugosimonospora africana]